jgi:energy-coupling factor transporter ATP-binding protein EcfA2
MNSIIKQEISMCLIKFHNFSFRYKGNEEYALKDINLKIESNKFILLAGETGSGKTTFIRCLNGLIPQFYPGYYKGYVEVGKKNTDATQISNLSTEVGIVFQNPENQLIAMNVEHEIAFGLENLGVHPDIIRNRIKDVVKLTEIEGLLDKAPYELSGGEQQRVAIASILVLEPKLIILDEPTASLDPLYAYKIMVLLKKIQSEKKITIIISEHRLDLVLPFVDQIILIKDGKIGSQGERDEVINSKIFKNANVNKPFIYSFFYNLNLEGINAPATLEQALTIIQNLRSVVE